jgi:hypothetical protein
MANADDWAIVVGINAYPELEKLDGPENDARDFADWVTGAGGVPAANVRCILSTGFPPSPTAIEAQPTAQALENEFNRLDDLAAANTAAGKEERVGRRLYLFLAGHGFGPDLDGACLLMANATRVRTRYHIPGKPWANHFVLSGYFDEVLLFMDCCRESYPRTMLNMPDDFLSPRAARGRRFYGFSSKYGRLSRERPIGGAPHGVFSAALLKGLGGAAADEKGAITAASLKSYLFNNMKAFLSPEDLLDPDMAQEPDVFVDADGEESEFVIARVQPPTFAVSIEAPPGTAGRTVQVLDSRFAVVQQAPADGGPIQFKLLRGTYLAQVAGTGTQQVFDVDGTGAVLVHLAAGAADVQR